MRPLSIRVRLTIWFVAVFSIALAVFGISVWVLVRARLSEQSTQQLRASSNAVEHFMASQRATISRDRMSQELREEYESEDQAQWLQIIDEDGFWIFRSNMMTKTFGSLDLPQHLPPQGKTFQARFGKDHLRVLVTPIKVFGRQYTVQTAAVTNGEQHTLEELRVVFWLLAPMFILGSANGSYYMSRRALAAVDDITAKARSINDRNLNERLPSLKTNDELQRLSDTLNEMLARIEASFVRMRQFTADASHELRTPLSLIRTEAEIALRRARSEEGYRIALEHILRESERTTELIEGLLTLARNDSGTESLQLHPVECVQVLKEIANQWQAMFEQSHIRFHVSLPPDGMVVHADVPTLRRLLMLLLDNARKYTPPGGSVTLRAEIEPTGILVEVQDTGLGIDAEDLPHIFDRFYRVDKARGRAMGGAGLGLSLAQWIATQHQTTIEVRSTAGEGSRFAFHLENAPRNKPERPTTEVRPESIG